MLLCSLVKRSHTFNCVPRHLNKSVSVNNRNMTVHGLGKYGKISVYVQKPRMKENNYAA